jgi:threonine/homoserine/homoserine lactone efflux protein
MPFDPATLLAFAAASLAVYLAPGADMAYIAANSVPHGLRAGALAATGTVLGVFAQAIAAATGATAIFLVSPVAFEAVRWAGVAYLCWLGIRLLRAGAPELAAGSVPQWRAGPVILKGVAINLLNPKISLFFLAFLPQFADPAQGGMFAQLLTLGLLFGAGAILWCYFLAWAFARLGGWLARWPRAALWQNRVSGGAMILFAGLLAASGLRR